MGQEAVELICQNARKTKQNETISLWPLFSTKMKLILKKVLNKLTFGQKTFPWKSKISPKIQNFPSKYYFDDDDDDLVVESNVAVRI